MNLTVAYYKRSAVFADPGGGGVRGGQVLRAAGPVAVSLAPNLRRHVVSYTGILRRPLYFREAISALHDVVISDLRFHKRDKSAYHAYLEQQKLREAELRRAVSRQARQELLARKPEPIPAGLEERFGRLRTRYWKARDSYSRYLAQHDPELSRKLMPCDPVITVAQDVAFFECFSADESSYGCLSVDRGAFTREHDVSTGTTNVDYSWDLYENFQKLRSYRETRFQIDPAGFTVSTSDQGYHEEKIDLPNSWLRGFMQMQAAQSLPMRRVPISLEALYSVLAFLKRHRARRSPRALRFELTPGQPIHLVLEPWEQRIVLPQTLYEGQRPETIRAWGRDRLRVLGRLLPLIDRAEVFLLGSGLPSYWVAHLGDMRLTLGLSGWTANDWTAANAIDQILPPAEPDAALLGNLEALLKDQLALTFAQVQQRTGAAAPLAAAGLDRLALLGQVIHDLPAGLYRWRTILPVALSLAQIGEENAETVAGRDLLARRRVTISVNESRPDGLRVLEGQVEGEAVALLLDANARMLRGKCTCSHHFTGGLRRGPCRHLQALRNAALSGAAPANLEKWFASFRG